MLQQAIKIYMEVESFLPLALASFPTSDSELKNIKEHYFFVFVL